MKTKNERYGEINERYEIRASQLASLGFKQSITKLEGFSRTNLSVFHRPGAFPNSPEVVLSTFVLYCSDDIWTDKINELSVPR